MELRQLTTFRMVATMLSFSRAAATLNYVQSSVTTQIQMLEEELGVRLFDRLGKRVALTDAGKRLLHYTERILDLVDETRAAVANETVPGGTLTITAPETLCSYRIPVLLRQFRARFPQVQLIFRLSTSIDPWRSAIEGSADITFAIDEPIHSNMLVTEILGSGLLKNDGSFQVVAMEKKAKASIMHKGRFGKRESPANKTPNTLP